MRIIGEIRPAKEWTSERLEWDEVNKNQRRTMQPNSGYEMLQGTGVVQGRLIGGCIQVLEFAKGTEIWPEQKFWEDSILFFETSEPEPDLVKSWLRNYAAQGILQTANGIIFGKPQDEKYYEEYKEVIQQVMKENNLRDLPILYNLNFGHTEPKVVLPYGAMAEKTIVPKLNTVPVPEGVDPVIASALPSSALTSLFPLKWGANMEPGETVLINGATGVSGKLAVQIARLLGAGRIVATGRNEKSMKQVRELGADDVIDLKQSDQQLAEAFKKEAGGGYDIILDFLWGHPTEVLIQTLVPDELAPGERRIRLIQIGEKAGQIISLSADAMRTSGLEISGGAAGITPEAIAEGTDQVWEWVKEDKLHMDIETAPLQDIEKVWRRTDFQGKRIVIVP